MGPHRRSKDEFGGGAALKSLSSSLSLHLASKRTSSQPSHALESSRCLQTPSQRRSPWISPPSSLCRLSRRKDCWKSYATQRWSPMFKPWRWDGENLMASWIWRWFGAQLWNKNWNMVQIVDHPSLGAWDLEVALGVPLFLTIPTCHPSPIRSASWGKKHRED